MRTVITYNLPDLLPKLKTTPNAISDRDKIDMRGWLGSPKTLTREIKGLKVLPCNSSRIRVEVRNSTYQRLGKNFKLILRIQTIKHNPKIKF